jgi:hypothetical protein
VPRVNILKQIKVDERFLPEGRFCRVVGRWWAQTGGRLRNSHRGVRSSSPPEKRAGRSGAYTQAAESPQGSFEQSMNSRMA